MDRLETLKLPTRASSSRITAATASGTIMKDDRKSARSQAKKTRRKHNSARKKNVVFCRTEEAYTCQLSLLILLNTRSYNTLRPIRQDDSQRMIEFYPSLPCSNYRVSFDDLLYSLSCQETLPDKLPYLNALQQSLVDVLQLLHSHNISFPVSTSNIEFSRHMDEEWRDIRSLRLFLPLNKKVRWASDKLPPSWKADQLACAESIFFIPKFTRLASSPQPALLDLASQQALAVYLRENPTFRHEKYCLGIHPLTAELAHQIAYCLVIDKKAEKSREILESFFGGPMPLPEPGTPPDAICRTLSNLRARAVESGKHQSNSNTMLYPDLQAKLLVDSPAMAMRFVCCRAEVASVLRDADKKQWWLTAMDLYDTFLSSQEPSSRLERVCVFDLYHYRDRPI